MANGGKSRVKTRICHYFINGGKSPQGRIEMIDDDNKVYTHILADGAAAAVGEYRATGG